LPKTRLCRATKDELFLAPVSVTSLAGLRAPQTDGRDRQLMAAPVSALLGAMAAMRSCVAFIL